MLRMKAIPLIDFKTIRSSLMLFWTSSLPFYFTKIRTYPSSLLEHTEFSPLGYISLRIAFLALSPLFWAKWMFLHTNWMWGRNFTSKSPTCSIFYFEFTLSWNCVTHLFILFPAGLNFIVGIFLPTTTIIFHTYKRQVVGFLLTVNQHKESYENLLFFLNMDLKKEHMTKAIIVTWEIYGLNETNSFFHFRCDFHWFFL